ncbi:hypothetical protein LCGC14_0916590, partial [marine sediment metagenome]
MARWPLEVSLRVLSIFLLIGLFATVAQAAPAKAPTSAGGGSGGTVNHVSKQLQLFVAPLVRPTEAVELKRLVRAIRSIEDKGVRMTNKRRLRIARAALRAQQVHKVDATLLIAVARMETDFRALGIGLEQCRKSRRSHCKADCGITQHYISGKRKWVISYCTKLMRDYSLSFLKSAKEIASHIRYCQKRQKWNKPLRRCVLNRYNSGTFYRTAWRCSKRWRYCNRWTPKTSWVNKPDLTKQEKQHRYRLYTEARNRCSRVKYRCLARAAYWKKVMCFDHGAR